MPSASSVTAASAAPAFPSGFCEIAGRYDLLLCDVWGVLHDGLKGLRPAGEALVRYRQGGGRVVLVSNAPRPNEAVRAMLDRFGVPRDAYDRIKTSGDLTREMIEARGPGPFHVIGPERDLGLFEGLPGPQTGPDEAGFVVCTGLLDDETETVADYEPLLASFRARNLTFYCANPDLVVERGDKLIVCAGALALAYEAMGGEVVMAGKPHRPVYEAAARLGESLHGRAIDPSRILGIGDAIRTDIAGGNGFGVDTLLIARGIHAGELGCHGSALDEAKAKAWLHDQPSRPTYVLDELRWS